MPSKLILMSFGKINSRWQVTSLSGRELLLLFTFYGNKHELVVWKIQHHIRQFR